MGTLLLQSDQRALYDRIRVYAAIAGLLVCASGLLAYALSRRLQHRISSPILALAQMANAISTRHDYSVRADTAGVRELDQLTMPSITCWVPSRLPRHACTCRLAI